MHALVVIAMKGSAAVSLPTQALTEAELRRWVIKPGTQSWKHAVSNPSREDHVAYKPSKAEQFWLRIEIFD